MGQTYVNPTGTFEATPESDTFIFDQPATGLVHGDGAGGVDRVFVNIASTTGITFEARDVFNSGTFHGSVESGPYDPKIHFINVEDVEFVGTGANDTFRLKIGANTSDLLVNFDGGAGVDILEFDFSNVTTGLSFQVVGTTITSDFGTFTNIERFTIVAGAGDDRIRTGGRDDDVTTGAGVDTVSTGAGADRIWSQSTGGTIDGGLGEDFFAANYSGSLAAQTLTVGTTLQFLSGLTISNVENFYVHTGDGDDAFIVTALRAGQVDGGVGHDVLTYNVAAPQGQLFSFYGEYGSLYGTIDDLHFGNVEQIDLTGSEFDDTFSMTRHYSTYAPEAVSLDAAGGTDTLEADFGWFSDGTIFVVAADGSIDSNRGEFRNFERFTLTGGDQADTLTTGAGADTIVGGGGDDILNGGDGNDVLSGAAGTDTLIGGGGNDELRGYDYGTNAAPTVDILRGGAGDDTYYQRDEVDNVIERAGEGFDTILSTVDYILPANVEALTLLGHADASYDRDIPARGTGNSSHNVITGNEGNNVLAGLGGNDTLAGAQGDDLLEGGAGSDTASYVAASSAVTVTLMTTAAQDTRGDGIDTLASIENLTGSAHNDSLTGNAGANRLDGGEGSDWLAGGLGDDLYVVDNAGDSVVENAGEGTDTVEASVSYTLGTDLEKLTLIGAASINGTGNALANVLTGNAAANVLRAGAGNDSLDGGAGNDQMYGGLGDDIYVVDSSSDGTVEAAGEGTDHVHASVSHVLKANVEQLTLVGTAAINGTGNALGNSITGNAAANVLNGRAGADTMRGGAGDDTYFVDNASDVVSETSAGGIDLVKSSVSFTLGAHVEKLTLIGTAALDGTGNGLGNLITGNGAANLLSGAAGADTLIGLAGNDRLNGGTGRDTLTGGTGADAFLFDTALSASANVDRITDFSVADDTIQLDDDVFTAAGFTGTLSAGAFRAGTAAQDADDRIIYDSATGRIYYDADGNGAGAAVLFAQVNAGTALTNADFQIVG